MEESTEQEQQKPNKTHERLCLSSSYLGISYPDPGLRFDRLHEPDF